MRPILTLKKKPSYVPPSPLEPVAESAPSSLAAPAAPPEPINATQPAKPSSQEAKQARVAANRLVNEELRARRRAGAERLQPLVDAYVADHPLFNQTVWVEGVECSKPLAIGIHKAILTWMRQQPEALGCSSSLLIDLIRSALESHVIKPSYLAGLLKFQDRFDLDGNPNGVVKDKHRARAEKALQKQKTLPAGEANATTRKAIAELEAGEGKRFASVDALMADLPATD
jgi:hypothetical protein